VCHGRHEASHFVLPAGCAGSNADTSVAGNPPPGGGGIGRPKSLTCYKVRCHAAIFPPVAVQDQFGARALTPTKTQLVSAPDA